ncbi:MAG: hypothetical protein NUV50_06600 [Rhodospirillales bacterium]|nr:hypothetical protein [Rhodospirillales bacterium]
MNVKWPVYLSAPVYLGAFLLSAGVAHAQEGSVTILSPMEGAQFMGGEGPHMLDYKVDPGPNGDHVHVYVDEAEVGILRELSGSYPLRGLGPGAHAICIKVVNKAHTPVGVERCVNVTASMRPGGMGNPPPSMPGY